MKPRWRWTLWNLGLWLHWWSWGRCSFIGTAGGWLMRMSSTPEWFGGPLDAAATGDVPF